MKSTTAAIRNQAAAVDPSKKLPYGPGRVKPADIKKAVNAVVSERLAAERAAKASK